MENEVNSKDGSTAAVLDLTDSFTVEQLQLMMGASLVLGFIFMLVVDQVGGGGHSHTHSTGWLGEGTQAHPLHGEAMSIITFPDCSVILQMPRLAVGGNTTGTD